MSGLGGAEPGDKTDAGDRPKYWTGGNARVGALGDHARATVFAQGDDSTVLAPPDAETSAAALKALAARLEECAQTPEQEEDVVRVQKAQAAAAAGDQAKAATWLSRLSDAGAWALNVATEIGSKVAVNLITAAIKGG